MATPDRYRFGGKSVGPPNVFHVRVVGDSSSGKPSPGVEIFHELPLRGTGWGAVARVAAAQRGLVHRDQLRGAGFASSTVRRMEARGALHPILPRVWAVGHPTLPPLGREFAAIMYLGRDAVISHRSAAIIWGILTAEAGTVEATIIGRDARRRPGLKIHRVALLDRRDVRIRDGIPTTSPARILLDLAAGADDVELHGALAEARVQNLVSDRELGAAMDRCPLRTGVARLRALLSAERGPALTRSEAERGLRALIDAGRLPRPRFNVRVHGLLVDAVWDGQRLVVEVDGFGVHGHRSAFETDRRRDQTLVANGYVVVRVTWRQLTGEPMAVLARLSQALAFAGRPTDA